MGAAGGTEREWLRRADYLRARRVLPRHGGLRRVCGSPMGRQLVSHKTNCSMTPRSTVAPRLAFGAVETALSPPRDAPLRPRGRSPL